MWSVASKVAGSGAGTKVAGGFLPESSKIKTAARFGGMITGGLAVGLGIMIIFFSHWIIGPISIAFGGFMLLLEFSLPFVLNVEFIAMVFDYKIRGPIYIVFCVPMFFTIFTIAPALGCIFTGGCYCALGYLKGEKAEMPLNKQQTTEVKGAKKSSLSSQAEGPGFSIKSFWSAQIN
ncbi:hypothetical protein DFA_02915 [Cavenderia fasciculata]|uniref:Uncharacterized protein n=1 Tax=Cavenderia fasciculata TaxID=261658 RepID=F4PIU2_CACFS|nr:uncharacterized protein DFA_02915 [Cavenderia fasciculata]EGG24671.1 hypothetical protein DFA_02915 [Cavenderia fasciculata]|eukprot:XP_004362522.1 hypothetical protein DFA_02915 [Cavenderia fasciculata]